MRRPLPRCMAGVRRLHGMVETGAANVSSALILVTMLLISIDVVLRYIFNSPIPGVYNIVELMMVGVVFLAVASVQAHREHVKVELFTTWLPPRAQAVLDIFGHLVGLAIFTIITWQGGRLAWRSWVDQDYSMGIVHVPYWPGKWAFTIGLGLLCLRLLTHIVADTRALWRASPPTTAERGE